VTRDDAKVLWPIIKAYGEGKAIQTLRMHSDTWDDITDPGFTLPPHHYRIKPEPMEYVAALDAQGNVLGIERGALSVGGVIRMAVSPCAVARTVTLREVTE
jgi:hypothetical protein